MVIVMEECGEKMFLNDKEMIKREITRRLSIHLDTGRSPFPIPHDDIPACRADVEEIKQSISAD